MNITNPESNCLSTVQAARRLGVSPATLKKWRRRGIGPRWIKLAGRRVVYSPADLAAYCDANRHGTVEVNR